MKHLLFLVLLLAVTAGAGSPTPMIALNGIIRIVASTFAIYIVLRAEQTDSYHRTADPAS